MGFNKRGSDMFHMRQNLKVVVAVSPVDFAQEFSRAVEKPAVSPLSGPVVAPRRHVIPPVRHPQPQWPAHDRILSARPVRSILTYLDATPFGFHSASRGG